MEVKTLIPRLYARYVEYLNLLQSPFLLAVRLIWGWQFMMTGWGKWQHLDKITEFFTGLGIPFPAANAYFVSSLEVFGGIFLMLGLLSRLTTVPLAVTLIVAYATAERESVTALFSGNLDPFFAATPFLFLAAVLLILIFGPGKISLDHFLAKRLGLPL